MDESAVSALLAAAAGGAPPDLARRLMLQVTDTLGLSGEPADEADDAMKAAAALQAMAAAAPRDPLEAMLAAQMAACHDAAMRAMRRAAECTDYPRTEALYARQAARLMQLFMRQMEALERRRARAATTHMRAAIEESDAAPEAQPIAIRIMPARPPRPPKRRRARCNGAPTPRKEQRHRPNKPGPPS